MKFLEAIEPLLKAAEDYAKEYEKTTAHNFAETDEAIARHLEAVARLLETAVEYAKWGKPNVNSLQNTTTQRDLSGY